MGAPFFWDERPHPSLRRHLPQRGRQGRGSRGAALLDNHGADVPPKPSPLWGRCRRRMRSVLPRKKSSLGVCTAKGSRGRPQSPLVALAGAKSLQQEKSSRLDVDAKQSRGRPQSPLVASAEAKSPATKKTSSKRTISLDAGRSRPFGATMCKLWVEQLGGAPAGAQSYKCCAESASLFSARWAGLGAFA